MSTPIRKYVSDAVDYVGEGLKERDKALKQGYSDREFNSAKRVILGDIERGRKPNPKIVARLIKMVEKGAPLSEEEMSILQQYL